MAIQVGDKIPECTIKTMGDEGPEAINTQDVFAGKRVVLFAVPGAFTPGCSATHFPGYIVHADKIKAKGVDTIACVSVNDAFVMGAWAKSQNSEEILMLADGNGELTEKLGLVLDGSGFGLGMRSQRYSMLVEDGEVKALNLESGPSIEESAAEKMLEIL